MPQDRRYLYRNGNRWYARIPVPGQLRGKIATDGRKLGPFIQKSLGTSDVREAQRRRWDVKREVDQYLKACRPESADSREYGVWRTKLEKAGPVSFVIYRDEHGWEDTELNPDFERIAEHIQYKLPGDHPAHTALNDHIKGLLRVPKLLSDYLEHNPKRSPTTATNYKAVVGRWCEHHGDTALSPDWVTRKLAADWFATVTAGKARDTAKRYATVMGHLWDWQYRYDDNVQPNPFKGLLKLGGHGGHKAAESYEAFTDQEVQRILDILQGDRDLLPVVLISLHSGLRLGEVLGAERETVNGVDCFVVRKGKTRNAERIVPIHSRLQDVEVTTKLGSKALSVRFGRAKKQLHLPEAKTFHSLRKCFTTKLEQAGCPEQVAVRLLGHRPVSLSYRVYSAGQHVEELATWVSKIAYE